MNTMLKIALLHLLLLGAQAFYVYYSNKAQMKNRRYLYILAAPLVAALPVLFYTQDPHAYYIYEYSIVICLLTAAVADVTYVTVTNKEYLTDAASRRFLYSYSLICLMASLSGEVSIWLRAVCVILIASITCRCCIVKKHSWSELIKAVPLALFSFICAWVFVKYVIKV